MPIFRAGGKLIFYAHVPKCGGSAVSQYLQHRFGKIAFNDNQHTRRPQELRWNQTSPQHIEAGSLARLFPPGFFDAMFTIVRHPVDRIVSAYHFQREVERRVSASVSFSDWFETLVEDCEENPFIYDNHVRPMSDIVPDGAHVFYMEHGLDALIPWFDMVTGDRAKPRSIPKVNTRSSQGGHGGKVAPSAADIDRISAFYASDFKRFGYAPDRPGPAAPAPVLPEDFIAERDREARHMDNPVYRAVHRLFRKARE